MEMITGPDAFKTSLEKALTEIDPLWRSYKGLILTGSHAPEKINFERILPIIQEARQNGMPVLGICFGLQIASIEFARNVLNIPEANSLEIDPNTKEPIVDKLPGMRVGIRPVLTRMENHWHQFKLNMTYVPRFQQYFQLLITKDGEEEVVEEMTLVDHPFFILTQYHPEYGSSKDNPHPVLKSFINACKTLK